MRKNIHLLLDENKSNIRHVLTSHEIKKKIFI